MAYRSRWNDAPIQYLQPALADPLAQDEQMQAALSARRGGGGAPQAALAPSGGAVDPRGATPAQQYQFQMPDVPRETKWQKFLGVAQSVLPAVAGIAFGGPAGVLAALGAGSAAGQYRADRKAEAERDYEWELQQRMLLEKQRLAELPKYEKVGDALVNANPQSSRPGEVLYEGPGKASDRYIKGSDGSVYDAQNSMQQVVAPQAAPPSEYDRQRLSLEQQRMTNEQQGRVASGWSQSTMYDPAGNPVPVWNNPQLGVFNSPTPPQQMPQQGGAPQGMPQGNPPQGAPQGAPQGLSQVVRPEVAISRKNLEEQYNELVNKAVDTDTRLSKLGRIVSGIGQNDYNLGPVEQYQQMSPFSTDARQRTNELMRFKVGEAIPLAKMLGTNPTDKDMQLILGQMPEIGSPEEEWLSWAQDAKDAMERRKLVKDQWEGSMRQGNPLHAFDPARANADILAWQLRRREANPQRLQGEGNQQPGGTIDQQWREVQNRRPF